MVDHEGKPDWEDYEPEPGECTHDNTDIDLNVGGIVVLKCLDCGQVIESPEFGDPEST